MLQSHLFYKTLREAPKDEQSINAKLLLRAAFVHKEMAGVFSYLPLGLRVLRKIENIVREEMNIIGGQEIFMSAFQPKAIWEETGRWAKLEDIMYRCQEESGREVGLGATHEEMITNIVRQFVNSYEDLPLYLYQIQTKFRKELRAKSGLLRGRELGMKDLYSFHASDEDLRKFYEIVKKSYLKIIKACGLDAIVAEASGGAFTQEYTHEFQVLAQDGEDTIFYCEKGDFAQNKEISKSAAGQKCPKCGSALKQGKSIEVGNIFPLGTRYSKDMNAYFLDKDGQRKLIVMGCYGLGVSRLIGSIVEVHHDEKGIIWPQSVAPFDVHLIQIQDKVKKQAEKLYENLQKENVEVLYDDRTDASAGQKLVEADLIGIPWRIVVSEKTLAEDSVEIKKRGGEKVGLVKISQLKKALKL